MPSPSKRKGQTTSKRKKVRKTIIDIPIDPIEFDCSIRTDLESNVDTLACALEQKSSPSLDSSFRVLTEPFKCAFIDNLIQDDRFVDCLQKEIESHIRFRSKNNDLYRFAQSQDLLHLQHLPHCQAMTDCLMEQLLPVLRKITGFQLYQDCVDITVSKYEKNDVLLCHDDMLEDRRIAFILYLVDQDWNESDGGHLYLFGRDDANQPTGDPLKILPKRNTMIFFEVTPHSFHQVAEVVSDRTRLSVNGWFRGPRHHKIVKHVESFDLPIKFDDHIVEEINFRRWINPLYLTDEIQAQIKNEFQTESQISLADFIDPELYRQVELALQACDDHLIRCGPYNRRNYQTLKQENHPQVVKELIQVMTSEAMFLTLGNITGLKLHPMNPDEEEEEEDSEEEQDDDDDDDDEHADNGGPDRILTKEKTPKTFDPRCQVQVGKFSKGDYTLIHDFDGEVLDKDPKLDVYLHLDHPFECQFDAGGFIEYVEKRGDDHLLTVEPQSNHLSVVYRDGKTLRFMKYLNQAHQGDFYQISLVFKE